MRTGSVQMGRLRGSGRSAAAQRDSLAVIERLYDAALDPTLWRDALDRLALATGGIGTAMIPITPGDCSGLVVSPELDETRSAYDREWWRYDSRVARIHARKLSVGVVCEADLFTPEELAKDPFRQEFCRIYKKGDFACQLSSPFPGSVVAFSVQRAAADGRFERGELDRLRLIGPHAARAAVLSHQLGFKQTLLGGLSDALEQLNCGAILIERSGFVLFVNAIAEKMMGDGLAVARGRLAISAQASKALDRVLRSARLDDGLAAATGPLVLPRPSGRKPLLLQAVPVGSSYALASSETHGGLRGAILLLLIDTEATTGPGRQDGLRALGLTVAQARVADLIGSGHSRPEAAMLLGVSEWTVRDTLKAVYSKLAISRQSELVRLVERLAVLSASRPG